VNVFSTRNWRQRLPRFTPVGATSPSVCIIGGGMAGIAAGVNLIQAGFANFTIYEKSHGLGGTWWDNRYPGAECDVPSHLYSFGFCPYDWSRSHAQQKEIQEYLEHVVDRYGIRSHFRFGISVQSAVWSEDTSAYDIELSSGERQQFDIVISAVGLLNKPNLPTWPGMDKFQGRMFHTARWDPTLDLRGDCVAVVGTGSTAVQVVAEIAPISRSLLVFQREPGWVLPKASVAFTAEQRTTLRRLSRRLLHRFQLRYTNERGLRGGAVFRPGSRESLEGERAARAFIEQELGDRPDLAAAVTPSYPYPGKRPVLHATYYAALKKDHVTLVPRAVASLTANGVVDVEGTEHPVDTLVLATGFHAAEYLADLTVIGRNGMSLHEWWAGEPSAFLGVTVPHFPNFFLLYGPNTNGGEIVFMLERGAEHVARSIKQMKRRGAKTIEVREMFWSSYNRWLQNKLTGTSWSATRNYFTSQSGRVVTQWPFGALLYGALLRVLGPLSNRFD
jgi:cation diffusion facilitator CzcD-associated flavoprotein CzcO